MHTETSEPAALRWNTPPVYFRGYMGFRDEDRVGFRLLTASCPPDVIRVELLRDERETAMALQFADGCSRLFLGSQDGGLFAEFQKRAVAEIEVFEGDKMIERYRVPVALAKY